MTFMQNHSQAKKVGELLGRRLGWKSEALVSSPAPFGISRPNIHDSKKEFRRERNTIQAVMESILKIVKTVYKSEDEPSPEHEEMVMRLS